MCSKKRLRIVAFRRNAILFSRHCIPTERKLKIIKFNRYNVSRYRDKLYETLIYQLVLKILHIFLNLRQKFRGKSAINYSVVIT